MSIIPALRRLRKEDYKFEASLGYIVSPKKKNVVILSRLLSAIKMMKCCHL
jgi:hypothetical protein